MRWHNIMPKQKPIVLYQQTDSTYLFPLPCGTWVARITPVNHPKLGGGREISTSAVVRFDPESGVIETRNTVYMPKECV